jgi:hypothetical protein
MVWVQKVRIKWSMQSTQDICTHTQTEEYCSPALALALRRICCNFISARSKSGFSSCSSSLELELLLDSSVSLLRPIGGMVLRSLCTTAVAAAGSASVVAYESPVGFPYVL